MPETFDHFVDEKGAGKLAWPFEEALKLRDRLQKNPPSKGYLLLETGYGPSGLPHIGTFGEVVRTTFVRRAFQALDPFPTRLICFSDDMDGLRKVPTNVPGQEEMARFLGKPLTAIPDPFQTHDSFGHHNNARLRHFLDSFGFEYEFYSATECYRKGLFDETIKLILAHYQEILDVILPTLGPERKETYSPFLPLCPETGVVLQVPVDVYDVAAGTVLYRNNQGQRVEVPVTGGCCKLQWKVDWAMRWVALGVDYEMSGKDIIDSVKISSQICRILGHQPPQSLTYEHFLDDQGGKISKSKGNGLSIEEWLSYAPWESLSYFMYQTPRRAKRLNFDVIPRQVDDYFLHLEKFDNQTPEEKIKNPVWHIHQGKVPKFNMPLSFSMLLNLVSICQGASREVVWGFIVRYKPEAEGLPELDRLVRYAVHYYHDFVAPKKQYRSPDERERKALLALSQSLESVEATPESIQTVLYEVGRENGFHDIKAWFQSLYQLLLGQEEGPRMGSFIAIYGVIETQKRIQEVLTKGEETAKAT